MAVLRHARCDVAYLALLLVALFAGIAVLATPASATRGQPEKQLPFHTVFSGSSTPNFAPGFPFERSTFGGRCSIPSDFMTVWDGTGYATHAGRFTVALGTDCARVNLATGDLEYGEGEFTAAAANGDTLDVTYTNGHGNINTGTFTDEWTIEGGTGRFDGATGQGTNTFQVDVTTPPPTRPYVDTGEGWISYDASQRRK